MRNKPLRPALTGVAPRHYQVRPSDQNCPRPPGDASVTSATARHCIVRLMTPRRRIATLFIVLDGRSDRARRMSDYGNFSFSECVKEGVFIAAPCEKAVRFRPRNRSRRATALFGHRPVRMPSHGCSTTGGRWSHVVFVVQHLALDSSGQPVESVSSSRYPGFPSIAVLGKEIEEGGKAMTLLQTSAARCNRFAVARVPHMRAELSPLQLFSGIIPRGAKLHPKNAIAGHQAGLMPRTRLPNALQ